MQIGESSAYGLFYSEVVLKRSKRGRGRAGDDLYYKEREACFLLLLADYVMSRGGALVRAYPIVVALE